MLFDEIVVSTDSKEIAKVSRRYGADTVVMRDDLSHDPKKAKWLSSNECGTHELMSCVVDEVVDDDAIVACIYATAPLMCARDLRRGYEVLHDDMNIGTFVFSVGASPLRDAGQFYFASKHSWACGCQHEVSHQIISEASRLIVVPEHRVCDINTPEDWARAEQLYKNMHV